jgi:hypothetical protein
MRGKKLWWLAGGVGVVLVMGMVAVAVAILPGAGAAQGRTRHYGPFSSTSPDSGTCGNNWAVDAFDRHFTVDTRADASGAYSVTEEFKDGTFVTNAGASPGSCQPDATATTLAAGVTGKMHGDFIVVVTGGSYNASAVCTVRNRFER